jgi:hypothetical protein
MLEALHGLYRELPLASRFEHVARDVIILHLASQSNLYAAISWTLVNLLLHPGRQATVREDPALLEACALESIRLAQRSLTLRKVRRPCRGRWCDGGRLQPGTTSHALLSVGNQALPVSGFDPGTTGTDRRRPTRASDT